MMKFFFLIVLLFLGSCHLLLDRSLPSQSLNFNEHLGSLDLGKELEYLASINESKKLILSTSPPVANFQTGEYGLFRENFKLLVEAKKNLASAVDIGLFCTFNPNDSIKDIRNDLDLCKHSGGLGIKFFHGQRVISKKNLNREVVLNDQSTLYAIEYAAKEKWPVMFVVSNNSARGQLLDLVKKYPSVDFVCSNMCFSFSSLETLESVLTASNNLYVDYSFLSAKSFYRFLKAVENDSQKARSLFNQYAHKLIYSSGLVFSNKGHISKDYIRWFSKMQYQFISSEKFTYYVPKASHRAENFIGLGLSKSNLDKVYYKNAQNILFK